MTPKKYKVWWPEQGQTKDDARVFEGFDHEHAAAEWADWYDHYSAEYSIVGGAPAEVQVLREDECAARAVLVTGQLSRTYSGHTLTANKEPYKPGNCVWATSAQQALNRDNVRKVVLDGIVMSLKKACDILGINYTTVVARVRRSGGDVEMAMGHTVTIHSGGLYE